MKKNSIIIKKIYNKIPLNLQYLINVYLLGIAFFTMFRLALAFVESDQLTDTPIDIILGAFFMGFRFDSVISGYLMIFPFLYTMLLNVIPLTYKLLKIIAFGYFALVYIIAFAFCAADIPFFTYYNSRLSASILNWASTPGIMYGYLMDSTKYYPYFGLFIVVCALFIYFLLKISKKWHQKDLSSEKRKYWRLKSVPVYLVAVLVLFIAIRGRIEYKSPIKWGTAFFSVYPFPNQLGLNPVFTFGRSYLDKLDNKFKYPKFFDDSIALNETIKFFHSGENPDYPLVRFIQAAGKQTNYNVVLVLMESMSCGYMGESGIFSPTLTPFLDSLTRRSLYFPRFYSSGVHTFNGLWSVCLSMPSIPIEGNLMEDTRMMQQFSGIARHLCEIGYQTLFACPHDEQFDNIGGMMNVNGFQKIISQKNYLDKDIISPLGVADHVLFQRTIPELNKLHSAGKPFFTTILTSSNHGPYTLPEPYPGDFAPKSNDIILKAVEYSDWSIKYFLQEARKEPWFDNTLFVFVADHGARIKPKYEMDLNYHHIPLIIYAPKILGAPQRNDNLGSQTDVFPTIMHLLNISYYNNTFGIDLLSEKREFTYFTADTKIGVIKDSLFLLHRSDGTELLYDYTQNSTEDISSKYYSEKQAMSKYALSQVQSAVWLIQNKKVSLYDERIAKKAKSNMRDKALKSN